MQIKKYYIILAIIILFGGVVRLINLDKSGGLWYDEITIYSIASQNTLHDMLTIDTHRFLLFPLYYIIYHFWLILFGNSDFTIRLMSYFFDILSIFCAFFAGKELGKICNIDKYKTGLIYTSLYCINSLIIYYAQEAKFYSLSLLLVNIILLFWLKYIQNQNPKNFLLLCLSNLALSLVYTSQILFILLLYITTVIYFFKSKIKIPINQILIFPSVLLPVIIFCTIIPKYFSGNFDAVSVDWSFILLILQNFFSPMLNSLQNNILNYQNIFFTNILNIPFLILVIFPVTYMLYSIFKSLKQSPLLSYLLGFGISYLMAHLLLSHITNYNVLVRYCIPVLPIFLLVASISICKQKRLIPHFIYIFICIIMLFSPYSATKIARPDGYKQLGELLKRNSISQSSDFILPIRTNLLDKYYFINGSRHSLYTLNSEEFQKTYLTEEEINNLNNNKYNAYKRYFLSDDIPKEFEKLACNKFIEDKSIVLITDKTISMYSNEEIRMITQSNQYEKFPLQFLRLSKLNNDLILTLQKNTKHTDIINDKNWIIYIFTM